MSEARGEPLWPHRWERAAAWLASRAPRMPQARALDARRMTVARAILDDTRAERAALHSAWRAACAAGDEAARDRAEEAVGEHAEALVAMLRARMARSPGLVGLIGRLDARLPTDATEHLDDPALPEPRRMATMEAIDRFNHLFGSYLRFADALRPLLDDGDAASGAPLVLLDIASGHGGFPLALAERIGSGAGHRMGGQVRLIASDIRPEYVAIGRRAAAARGLPVEFAVVDAFRLGRAGGDASAEAIDVITCTQTLHHFGAAGTARLLVNAVARARRGILFVDLSRALVQTAALVAVGVVGTRDASFVHDALVSARKAFVPEELALIAAAVPGGESLEALHLRPGFAALRTRVGGAHACT